jgi:hypothetical protein
VAAFIIMAQYDVLYSCYHIGLLLMKTGSHDVFMCICAYITHKYIYRMSEEVYASLRESVPYVKVYRYNPKHLYPMLNDYGDNAQRSLKL